MSGKLVSTILLLTLVCAFIPAALQAQSEGSVSGRVFDQTQALIPGVSIELAYGSSGIALTTITDGDGTYRFSNVPACPVEITFRLINFSTVRRSVTIQSGAASSVDVTLVVSSSADITVTAPLTFRNLADLERPAENIVGVAGASS